MVKFDCTHYSEGVENTWTGRITVFLEHNRYFEVSVDSCGTKIRIIFGYSVYGSFICLPNYGVSYVASTIHGSREHYERLAPVIGEVHAVTVSQALQRMSKVLF